MDSLPPDPYKALGISKDADLPAIRSAHRKLVLKCHPDKVQDPELKAVKQDEFQAVQQAYELLSDEKRRLGYDEKVKLFELRKEMGRGNPTARSNPFEYEIRTAEPRTTSSAYSRPAPKVYTQSSPRTYEDMYEEPMRAAPRKSTSYEERKRTMTREEERDRERRKWEEEDRLRAKAERKTEKSMHSDKKKSRDKERRRGTEEKTRTRTTAAYVEDDSDDDYRPSPRSDKRSRQKMEEEIRQREEAARAAEAAHMAQKAREREREQRPALKSASSMDPKWNEHMERAGQYMQAAKQKVNPEYQHPGMPRRAETFAPQTATYNVRYATPQQYSDEDTPRRSSARKESRRSSETPMPRTSSRDKSKTSRRSPPAPDAYIVEPPSPPPIKKPSLQTHSSAPPILPTFPRKEPSRSKTSDYPRVDKAPSLPRAQTFNVSGDRGRERGGSRLKQQVLTDSDSESDAPVYAKRHSHSPPRRVVQEPTRYIIDNGRSVPIKSRSGDYRADLRNAENDPYTRERSESPRGGGGRHSAERPHAPRQSSDRPRAVPTRSQSHNYYQPDATQHSHHPADPIILTARPKMSPREGSHRSQGGAYFGEVAYGPSYGPENIIYANHPQAGGSPPEAWRRGSDPSHHRAYENYARSGREQVYV